MTFSSFDLMLPIGMGVVFGLLRYTQWKKTHPEAAARLAVKDAVTGMIGMGIMTVAMKYLGLI